MSAIVAVPYDSAISKVSKTEEPSLSVTVSLGRKKEAVVKNFRISGLDLADLQLESLHQSAQQVLGVDYPLIIRNVSPNGAKFCLNKQEKLVRALSESDGSLTLLCRRKFGGKSKKQEESYVDWIPIDEEDLSADEDDSEPERLTPPPQHEDAEVEDAQKPRRRGRHHKHCYHYHEECRKQREQEESGESTDASQLSRDEKRAARLLKREAKQEEKKEKRQVREHRKALKEARKEEKQAEKAARKAMKEERKQEKKAARAAAKQEESSSEESGTSSDEGEQQKPRERFAEHLKVLAAMGFTKERMNLRLLKRFDGDVTKVAQEIMSKQLKREEKEHKPASPRRTAAAARLRLKPHHRG